MPYEKAEDILFSSEIYRSIFIITTDAINCIRKHSLLFAVLIQVHEMETKLIKNILIKLIIQTMARHLGYK